MASQVIDKKNRPDLLDITLPDPGSYWGGLNRYDTLSRWTISDNEFDWLVNWLPMGPSLRQVPGNSASFATLAAPIVWMEVLPLNGTVYLFALCINGHLYQVRLSDGTITDCSGATSLSAQSDITCWQGTNILVSDPVAQNLYNWNGTVFATAISSVKWNFIEVFSNRLWGANSSTNTLSWTNSGTFNSLSGDAGAVTITDAAVVEPINALKTFQGSLYIWGPDYIQTVSNLQDTGSPAVLIFQLTVLQATIGTNSKWSIMPIGSSLYFANNYGFWVLNGAIPELISTQVSALFSSAGSPDPNAITPWSAAYCQVFSEPVLLWHYKDSSNTEGLLCRTVLAETEQQQISTLGAGADWFLVQLGNPVFVTSYVLNGNPTAYGCDSTGRLFYFFKDPNAQVSSTLQTKIWDDGFFLQEDVLLYFGIAMICMGSVSNTIQMVDQSNKIRVVLSQQNVLASFVWSNNNTTFNWTNGGLPFAWTNFPVWAAFQWPLGAITRMHGFNITTTGASTVLQAMARQVKRTPSTWGANQTLMQ